MLRTSGLCVLILFTSFVPKGEGYKQRHKLEPIGERVTKCEQFIISQDHRIAELRARIRRKKITEDSLITLIPSHQ